MDETIFDDKGAEEFDEQIFGGPSSKQPLTLWVRRYHDRQVIVISWKVENWPEWENPMVVGRKYDHHNPTSVPKSEGEVNDPGNPSHPIGGGPEEEGKTGEIEIKAGETAYFGFWLQGQRLPKPKGLLKSKWKPWTSDKPIALRIQMTVRTDTVQKLRERRTAEQLKNEVFSILRERETWLKPKEQKPAPEDAVMQGLREAMKWLERQEDLFKMIDDVNEKEDAQVKIYQQRAARGELDPTIAEERIQQTRLLYSNAREMILRQMPGELL